MKDSAVQSKLDLFIDSEDADPIEVSDIAVIDQTITQSDRSERNDQCDLTGARNGSTHEHVARRTTAIHDSNSNINSNDPHVSERQSSPALATTHHTSYQNSLGQNLSEHMENGHSNTSSVFERDDDGSNTSRDLDRSPERDGTCTATATVSSDPKQQPFKHLLKTTSENDRAILRHHLATSVSDFLRLGHTIYLDRLGFFIPLRSTHSKVRSVNNSYIIRNETIQKVSFEKCSELSEYHRERYPSRVELNDLARYMYPRLPLELNIRFSERDIRGFLREMAKLMRHELILTGSMAHLEPVGTLCCLHNRQGSSLHDWYAGADIFIKDPMEQIVKVDQPRMLEMPVLVNAWEPFEAAYGDPCETFSVDVVSELRSLGYDSDLGNGEDSSEAIKLAVFKKDLHDSQENCLVIYCSEGLREFGLEQGNLRGVEFVFQVQLSKEDLEDEDIIQRLPRRAFMMAWVLLQSSKSKIVRPGTGIDCDLPLFENFSTTLSTIMTTPFRLLPEPSLSESGEFSYVNIVGITADEAEIARSHSPEFLVTLLSHRKMDQVTRPGRSSLITNAGYQPHMELVS